MARITVEQVKELRAKATPGPWQAHNAITTGAYILHGHEPVVDSMDELNRYGSVSKEDAELIAAAHDMADLIEELAAERSALNADIENYVSIANELAAQNAELKAELAAFVHGFRITIPTAAMEQEFATHYRRGYEQGKRDATVGK